MFHDYAPLLPEDVIARAGKMSVAMILDGVKSAGIDIPQGGCMVAGIKPISPDMKVLGTAMTIESDMGDNFPIHLVAYEEKEDGYVLVIDGKNYQERAYCGDLLMTACQLTGIRGIVIDGFTRDREGNIEIGFPVFSRGLLPRGPIKKNEGEVNVPISCGGVEVCPGDLVMGDCDGVCVIPKKYIDVVLGEAEKKMAYEDKRHETLAAYRKAKAEGTELPELAPQWVIDMRSK